LEATISLWVIKANPAKEIAGQEEWMAFLVKKKEEGYTYPVMYSPLDV